MRILSIASMTYVYAKNDGDIKTSCYTKDDDKPIQETSRTVIQWFHRVHVAV